MLQPVVGVIDDDGAVLKALERLLRSVGLKPLTYSSGGDFLAETHSGPPDCLVVDIQMEKMNGLELQDVLLTTGRGLPIIFITGNGGRETEEIGLRRGAVACLRKPFSDEDLLDALHRALPEVIPQRDEVPGRPNSDGG